MDVAALIVAIASAIGAAAAAWYARGQAAAAATSAAAAQTSATADQRTAALDMQRRHDELTPHFRITLKEPLAGAETLRLSLFIDGPSALHRLDGLTVKILDDRTLRDFGTSQNAGRVNPQEADTQIWGPYRFAAGEHIDDTGRTAVDGS
jgi:hypothetical protein